MDSVGEIAANCTQISRSRGQGPIRRGISVGSVCRFSAKTGYSGDKMLCLFQELSVFFFLFLTFRGIAKDTKPGEMIAWTEKGERDFWRPIGESVPREEL